MEKGWRKNKQSSTYEQNVKQWAERNVLQQVKCADVWYVTFMFVRINCFQNQNNCLWWNSLEKNITRQCNLHSEGPQ